MPTIAGSTYTIPGLFWDKGGMGFNALHPEIGGTGDGETEDTAAFTALQAAGAHWLVPAGTYLADIVHSAQYALIQGAGCDSTILKAFTADGYAFSERFAGSGFRRHVTLNDLCLEGDSLLRGGLVFGDPDAYSAGAELFGRSELNRIQFRNCKIGIYKPYGNIGNVYNNCTWRGTQDFCYYALGGAAGEWGVGTGPMQTSDIFNGGHMGEAALAAVYIDDGPTAGQTILDGIIIEGCAGFGIFVYNYPNTGAGPFTLRDVWLEANATAESVTINETSYTPRDLYFRNAEHVVIERTKMSGSMELVNSNVVMRGCQYNQDTIVADDDSSLIHEDIYSSQCNIAAGIVNSYAGVGDQFGGAGNIFTIPPRCGIVYGYNAVWSEPYNGAGDWRFTGTALVDATQVSDGIIYSTCAELGIPTGYTLISNDGELSFTEDKWYVYSIDVKQVGDTAPTSFSAAGTATLFPDAVNRLVADKWVTIGGIGKANASSSASLPRIANTSGSTVTLRFSAAQVVEFDTAAEAIAFFNARLYQEG